MSAVGHIENYDLVILGSGAGAKLLAWTFAQRGQRVAAIERKYIGGACPNIACLPSKNIIHTAQVAHYVRNSEEFGIATDGFSVRMPRRAGTKAPHGAGPGGHASRSLPSKWCRAHNGLGTFCWASYA